MLRAAFAKMTDPCCSCGGCHAISVVATKLWPHFAPFPLWCRGSTTWSYGGDSTEFFRIFDGAFTTQPAFFGQKGYVATDGDMFFHKRYLNATWHTTGVDRTGSEDTGWVDNPFDYTYSEAYDRYSGQLISAVGTHGGGTWYSYSLNNAGVISTSGSSTGWRDYPILNVPQRNPLNWTLLIATQPGAYATVEVTENTAALTIFVPGAAYGPSASDITFTNTVTHSEEYADFDLLSDLQDMLDGFDFTNLSKTYSPMYAQASQQLQWDRRYGVSYEHGNHSVNYPAVTPRRLFYVFSGYPTPAASGKYVCYADDALPSILNLSGWSESGSLGKAIVYTTGGHAYSYYNEELTPSDPSSSQYVSPVAPVYPAQTDCVVIPAASADDETFLIDPTSIMYPLGTLTLSRECAGDATCTPT